MSEYKRKSTVIALVRNFTREFPFLRNKDYITQTTFDGKKGDIVSSNLVIKIFIKGEFVPIYRIDAQYLQNEYNKLTPILG